MARFAVLGCTYIFPVAQAVGWWDTVEEDLNALKWLGPFNLLVGHGDLIMANITVGEFSSTKKIEPLWSASKWAAGAVFFNLDAEGVLPLDTKVSDHLPYWTNNSDDARSRVTVRNLLDFASGFAESETDPELSCWLDPTSNFDACAEVIYNRGFVEEKFGKLDYNEQHLQIAGAVALKATGAASWGELWYERVGQPSGLPPGSYWTFPSKEHPQPGTGMSITSDEYAKFMIAFHSSLISEQPTQPLKLAPDLDLLEGNRDGVKEPGAGYETAGYASTSWRWANGLVESNACIGFFPAIMAGTAPFWMQLGRDGGSFHCTGAVETDMVIKDLVAHVIEKVEAFYKDQAAQPLEIVLTDTKCERDEAAEYLCGCQDWEYAFGLKEFGNGESCLEKACWAGASLAACTSDQGMDSFYTDYFGICTTCADDGEGAGQGDSSCVRIPSEVAQKYNAQPCRR